MSKTKIFLSHPMTGLTDEEVMEYREKALNYIRKEIPDAELIDTYRRDNVPEDADGFWYLGESIKDIQHADVIYLAHNWKTSHGCKIEEFIFREYGKSYTLLPEL